MELQFLHPKATLDHVGLITSFLDEKDPRPAAEQFQTRYIGGWHPFKGFIPSEDKKTLHYPGDPDTPALAKIILRDEDIYIYLHAWVMIFNKKTNTFEISRMD